MIEFTVREVYAYEDSKIIVSAPSKGHQGLHDTLGKSKSQCGSQSSDRVEPNTLANRLPPLLEEGHTFESYHVDPTEGIFGGRHDGTIMHWSLSQSQNVANSIANTLRGHVGAVLTLDFALDLGPQGLLFSGSADRSIKIWDPWGDNETSLVTKSNKMCVQTLTEHRGSVVCLRILEQHNHGIVSCSLDRTVKTWYPAEDYAPLFYPRYLPAQTILQPGSSWPSALCVRSETLFVGDSDGNISMYALTENVVNSETAKIVDDKHFIYHLDKKKLFAFKRKFSRYHSLGISRLQVIADNCFVVSLGYDEKAQIIDAISGALSSAIYSSKAARFISCTWDIRSQTLLLGDVAGYVHLWNIFEDKLFDKKRMVATYPLAIVMMYSLSNPSGDFLLTGLANGVKLWHFNHNVGYVSCNGHSDAVVAVVVIDNDTDSLPIDKNKSDEQVCLKEREVQLKSEENYAQRMHPFLSASLDGSIRCWESHDMKMSLEFEDKDSDITCMVASLRFHKFFTGHTGGIVKVWNNYAGKMSVLSTKNCGPVTCLAAGAVRDQEVLLAGVNGNVFAWNVNYDQTLRAVPFQLTLIQGEITALLFCKGCFLGREGHEFFVAGFLAGQITVWSFAKNALVCSFKGHKDAVCSLTSHGCFLFSGSDDTLLRMWNVLNLTEAYELGILRPPSSHSSSGSESPIVCLDVVPARGFVLSGAADGTLIVWDYTAFEDENAIDAYGKIVSKVKVDGCIKCLRYWPDRKAMICGTAEGKIIVLDLPSDENFS